MGLKESLKKLQEKERLSIKREVKKEFTKITKEKKKEQKCIICGETAHYFLKGTIKGYCKRCALENFSSLNYLEKR